MRYDLAKIDREQVSPLLALLETVSFGNVVAPYLKRAYNIGGQVIEGIRSLVHQGIKRAVGNRSTCWRGRYRELIGDFAYHIANNPEIFLQKSSMASEIKNQILAYAKEIRNSPTMNTLCWIGIGWRQRRGHASCCGSWSGNASELVVGKDVSKIGHLCREQLI